MTYGDRNLFADDLLFFSIGQRIHDGARLYIDVWDRKPPGLFLIYYLIAGLSRNVIAYQLAGTLSVAATAEVLARISERIGNRWGAALVGILYLSMLPLVGGRGGQAAIFFNLPMATAALILLRALPELSERRCPTPVVGAMLLAGFAITCRQTAFFESIYFGLFAVWRLVQSGTPRGRLFAITAQLVLAGATPMLCFALAFAAAGHFDVFWKTMVIANTARVYNPSGDILSRLAAICTLLGPALALGVAASISSLRTPRQVEFSFAEGWLVAALVGFAVIPNMIDHYALPVLAPLSVMSAPLVSRSRVGFALGAVYSTLALIGTGTFDFDKSTRDNQKLDVLISLIRANDSFPRLFVFDGPVYLYTLIGSWPPTPLIFPLHLYSRPESNVSPYPTMSELKKVLDWRPTTVVVRHKGLKQNHPNRETTAAVLSYVERCRRRDTVTLSDMYGDVQNDVYSGCAEAVRSR